MNAREGFDSIALSLQRRHIDYKAILDVALEHAIVSLVDLLNWNHLDVGSDVVLAAEIEHLLRFRDSADKRAGELATLVDQAEHLNGQWLWRASYHAQGAITLEQLEIGIDVVRSRDRVEDEVKAVELTIHLVLVFRNHNFICAQALCVFFLVGRCGEQHNFRSHGVSQLEAHVAEAAQADYAHSLPFADFPMA